MAAYIWPCKIFRKNNISPMMCIVRSLRGLPSADKKVSLDTRQSSIENTDDSDVFYEDFLEGELEKVVSERPQPKKKLNLKKEYHKFLKEKIVEKKEKDYYGPKMPNLLTWAARAQIKYLNESDPENWTPKILAQSFPVTEDVILKILRNNRRPKDEYEIYRNDMRVYKNWLNLKEALSAEGGPIDPQYRLLVEGEKLGLMINAAGAASLPMPDLKKFLRTKADLAEMKRPKVAPVFSSLLERNTTEAQDTKARGVEMKDRQVVGMDNPDTVALLGKISEASVNENGDMDNEVYDRAKADRFRDHDTYEADRFRDHDSYKAGRFRDHDSYKGNRFRDHDSYKGDRFRDHDSYKAGRFRDHDTYEADRFRDHDTYEADRFRDHDSFKADRFRDHDSYKGDRFRDHDSYKGDRFRDHDSYKASRFRDHDTYETDRFRDHDSFKANRFRDHDSYKADRFRDHDSYKADRFRDHDSYKADRFRDHDSYKAGRFRDQFEASDESENDFGQKRRRFKSLDFGNRAFQSRKNSQAFRDWEAETEDGVYALTEDIGNGDEKTLQFDKDARVRKPGRGRGLKFSAYRHGNVKPNATNSGIPDYVDIDYDDGLDDEPFESGLEYSLDDINLISQERNPHRTRRKNQKKNVKE